MQPVARWSLAVLLLALAGKASAQPVCSYPVLDEAGQRPILKPGVSPDLLIGMPSPVVTPVGREGQWRIDGHRLVRYEGYWPVQDNIDAGRQKVEPWNGRVVATTFWANTTSVLDTGAESFRAVVGSALLGPFVLPRQRITVVLNAHWQGMVVRRDALEPWPADSETRGLDLRGLYSVHDSEILDAIVVHDLDHRLWARTDAGDWHRLAALDRTEDGAVLDAPRSGAAIYFGRSTMLAIRREQGTFTTHTLPRGSGYLAASSFFHSALLGELLHYGREGILKSNLPRWLRLRGARFEDIPDLPPNLTETFRSSLGLAWDVPSLGKVALRGRDGLYLYDGERATLVADSGWTNDLALTVEDLPAIGRVIVRANGRSEQLIGGRLEPAPQFSSYRLVDWPGRGVLGWTRDRLILFDKNLVATPISLPSGLWDRLWGPTIEGVSRTASPRTGAMFVSTSKGIFVLDPKGPAASNCE
jgi:hypothetical protein